MEKAILRALKGDTLSPPPIWMMRQAGRYLPEYRATRAKAGDFLSLCYNSDLATEVTLQPIHRYGFDAAILFADILLLPQALGAKLWFVTGEGPRLSTIQNEGDFNALKPKEDIDETLHPIYQTLRNLKSALPKETALIGFAGAPWTVATYMVAGKGTPNQAPAHALIAENYALFSKLIDVLSEATIDYLSRQIEAGADIIKIFDSWAGSLKGAHFDEFCIKPHIKIRDELKAKHPDIPIIGFPRGAGERYLDYITQVKVEGLALDSEISPYWAAQHLQPLTCVQGNLDQRLLVSGGEELIKETSRIVESFKNAPHIFNLGHGITPDADPDNVSRMIDAIRNC